MLRNRTASPKPIPQQRSSDYALAAANSKFQQQRFIHKTLKHQLLFFAFCAFFVTSLFITFVFPFLKLSQFPPSVLEVIDQEYTNFHHLEDVDSSSSGFFDQKQKPKNKRPSKVLPPKENDFPECHIFAPVKTLANEHDFEKKKISLDSSSSASPTLLENVFRMVVFTDMHFGEDGALDLLTQEFQRKVLEQESENLDLIIVLGDDVSQEDYFELRRDEDDDDSNNSSSKIKNKKPMRIHSCLNPQVGNNFGEEPPQVYDKNELVNPNRRNSALYQGPHDNLSPALRCWREAHKELFQQTHRNMMHGKSPIKVVSLFGNHDAPALHHPFFSLSSKNNQQQQRNSVTSLNQFVQDLRRDQQLKKSNELLCTPFLDGVCNVLVISSSTGVDDLLSHEDCYPSVEEKEETRDKNHQRIPIPRENVRANILFFNSISDETDTFLLHGYKYPSSKQLKVGTKSLEYFTNNNNKFSSSSPFHIAFTHIPSALYMETESIQKFSVRNSLSSSSSSSFSYNETIGCSPKSLEGTKRFADFITAKGIDVLISGHDHKNDQWVVHDRNKLSEKFLGKTLINQQDVHLVYARHSGFGGYFDVANNRVPGVRMIEISEIPVSKLSQKNPAGSETIYCDHILQLYPDLKLCRLINQGSVVAILRSWILEAELETLHPKVTSAAENLGEGLEVLSQKMQEVRLKALEPAERLMHSEYNNRKVRIVGLTRIDQQLFDKKKKSEQIQIDFPQHQQQEECSGQMDFRVQFSVFVVFLWIFNLSVAYFYFGDDFRKLLMLFWNHQQQQRRKNDDEQDVV